MKLLSVVVLIIGYIVNNIDNTTDNIDNALSNIDNTTGVPQWNIPQNINHANHVKWNIPNIGITTNKRYKSKRPPSDVAMYVRSIAAKYQIQPAAILAACYHERGIKNWYDPFLCGFGATDDLNWNKSKWGGWQKQIRLFAKRANRCGYFKVGTNITIQHAQMFAKNCYKTTAWQNYGRIVNYINGFKI